VEGASPTPATAGGAFALVVRGLAVAGGLVVMGIALFVTASVALRWTTGFGIRGDFELVQIATAVSIFAFMPFCQWRRGNIFVDTFTKWMPEPMSRVIDALWDLVYAGLCGLIAWRLVVGAFESQASGTSSMVLALPQWPAILVASVLMGLLAITAAVSAARMARSGR
jgi:TRAP-type C4-dicarboxylate transport system permease small subunit